MDHKDFIEKLYVGINKRDLIDNKARTKTRFRPKELKLDNDNFNPLPGLRGKGLGNVIMQNWNTKANVPKDIGNCYNLPVIVDRKKVQKGFSNTLYLPSMQKRHRSQNDKFEKEHLFEKNKNLLLGQSGGSTSNLNDSKQYSLTQSSFSSGTNKSNNTMFRFLDKKINRTSSKGSKNEMSMTQTSIKRVLIPKSKNKEENPTDSQESDMIIIRQEAPKKQKSKPASQLIDFETFNQHLYLQDNDFLYAIRKGGPLDFALCTYQDINPSKEIPSKNPRKKVVYNPVEYITISKNTILHYHRGTPTVYSFHEWVENFVKFKQLIKIPLFKNFKTAKLFELWRRFFKKATRAYHTEKLKKRFQLIDSSLLHGIHEIKKILDEMSETNNIFVLDTSKAVFSTTFKEKHQRNITKLDAKIESYRQRVKAELANACSESYKAYKEAKKITLDDAEIVTQSDLDDKDKKKRGFGKNDGSIQNFLKDQIPYAQDATRKVHYKKLLRYIRVVDYLFNEAKYKLIRNSLKRLDTKFARLYEAYENQYQDSPFLIVTLFTMNDNIEYNPAMIAISDLIFEQFIQESIYTVIYKKSFIDPQEFPNYMMCFEEVFESSVDQNSNLYNRIKNDDDITSIFDAIKGSFNKCKKALDDKAEELKPILLNYNKYSKINFSQLEKDTTPAELKGLLKSFYDEANTVRQLKRIINIGLFELDINQLLELVCDAPRTWLDKMKKVIPNVIINRLRNLIEILKNNIKILSIPVNNVESFIKLKKAVEECGRKKNEYDNLSNEITDLLEIIENDNNIKLEDYDTKLISEQKSLSVQYERKFDSMTYFIDNNIKQYRLNLKVTIQKYDNEIKEMLSMLNDDKINKYSNDAGIPLMQLENQESSINQVIERKKLYQQLEIDLDMDEFEKSKFDNLDTLTYEYNLKCTLWHSVDAFQKMANKIDSMQVLAIDIEKITTNTKKWIDLCQVALVDLDYPFVPQGLLENVNRYSKIIPVLIAMQNPNVRDNDGLYEEAKAILGTSLEFNADNFNVERLINLDDIYENVPKIEELNHRANEEKRLHNLVSLKQKEFNERRLKFKYRQNSENKNDKFIFVFLTPEDLEGEFDYMESNLLLLNKSLLNPYSGVVEKEIKKLTYDLGRYMKFLNLFMDYQNYINRNEGIIFNGEFAKEMPAEIKKLLNENQLKNLIRTLKDNITLVRFMQDNIYTKATNTLNNLIDSFEKNVKAISAYLDKKRKEYPKYFALTDEELILLYESKESMEVKEKMIYKLYPWIRKVELVMGDSGTGEEFLNVETIQDEKMIIKVTKSSRTLRELIDTLDFGLNRKLKDAFKAFKRDYDLSQRPKTEKKPKQVLFDLVNQKDILSQSIFSNFYYALFEGIEKALALEEEAFDKLFDLYHEAKNEYRAQFIQKAKDPSIPSVSRFIYLSIISLINYYITIIERLIRDDVQKNTDFNFVKLLIPKIENDSFFYHLFTYVVEYGFEYTGHVENYVLMPDGDRFVLNLAHSFNNKKPFLVYGTLDGSMYAMMNEFYKLIGRNENKLICTESFTSRSITNMMYSTFKNGGWIVLDKVGNLLPEVFEIIATRVIEIYRVIQQSEEEGYFIEGNDKLQINVKNFNIFMVCDEIKKYPRIIDLGYYRSFGNTNSDYEIFVRLSFLNLSIKNADAFTKKTLFVIDYINLKCKAMRKREIVIPMFMKILGKLMPEFHLLKEENAHIVIANAMKDTLIYFMDEEEIKDVSHVIRRVFGLIDEKEEKEEVKKEKEAEEEEEEEEEEESEEKSERAKERERRAKEKKEKEEKENLDRLKKEELKAKKEEEDIKAAFEKSLSVYHFEENSLYVKKIKELFNSLLIYNSFLVIGPPLSGKSTLLHLIRTVTTELFLIDEKTHKQFNYVRLFLNASQSLLTDTEFTSSFDYFTAEKTTALTKLNMLDSELFKCDSSLSGGDPEKIDEAKAEKIKHRASLITSSIAQTNHRQSQFGFDYVAETIKKQSSGKDNMINGIVLDGDLSPKWLKYITSIYDKYNYLTIPNGDVINMNKYKIFFEACNTQHAEPSFLTRQCIISLNENNPRLKWDNCLYIYLETNKKVNENIELKNYIRGLFENYFPKLFDFVLTNKIHGICEENFTMRNLILLFDSVLPKFDFTDVRIGRRSTNSAPKIEIIKKQTLSIFIFSFAWTCLNLSNFVIKTKVEKLISDIFKADDLKGPIFDYFISPNTFDFEPWDTLLSKYETTLPKKGERFFYNTFFVPAPQTIPFLWISQNLLKENRSIILAGRECTGKTMTIKYLLNDTNEYNAIQYRASPNTTREDIQNYLYLNTNSIRRDTLGDKYGRRVVFFVDDVHLSQYNSNGSNEVHEFIRMITDTKSFYDSKKKDMKFLYKFTSILTANAESFDDKSIFNRCIKRFFFILDNVNDDYYISVYKPTLEFHLRNYIPNTSSITATQYIQVLVRITKILKTELTQSLSRLHIIPSISDITKIIQSFHNYTHLQSTEYSDYLKKLFFFETRRVFEDRMDDEKDKEFFRKKLCECYSSIFKQDKITPEEAFGKDYAFYRDEFYNDKSEVIEKIMKKISEYKGETVINDLTIWTIIRIIRGLERDKKNLIAIGKKFTGKISLIQLSAFIMGCNVVHINSTPGRTFKDIVSKKVLSECVYNNKGTILLLSHELIEADKNREIIETANRLFETEEIVKNFNFMDKNTPLSLKEINQRLRQNLGIAITCEPYSEVYYVLFSQYPFIVKSSSIIYFKEFSENDFVSFLNYQSEKLPFSLSSYSEVLLSIHTTAKELIQEYTQKIKMNYQVSSLHYISMCKFFIENYHKFYSVLQKKQQNYTAACDSILKCKENINTITSEINVLTPLKEENEKSINDKKEEKRRLNAERAQLKLRKQEEDKPLAALEKDKADREDKLKEILEPLLEKTEKAVRPLRDLLEKDMVEIKNTYENFNFGKYLLSKVYEIISISPENDPRQNVRQKTRKLTKRSTVKVTETEQTAINTGATDGDWDSIKRTLNTKIIQKFCNMNPSMNNEAMMNITKEICEHEDFGTEDKYQKPFRTCGLLCEYFLSCNNYYNEYKSQTELLNEINEIKSNIAKEKSIIEGLINNIKLIDKQIEHIDIDLASFEKQKSNHATAIEKKNALLMTTEKFLALTVSKKAFWEEKKRLTDNIIDNFNFYMIFLSAYVTYAPILNQNYRSRFEEFVYSKKFKDDIVEMSLIEIITMLLDVSGEDKNLYLSFYNFDNYLKENFLLLKLQKRIPFIIDPHRIAFDVMSNFIEIKDNKTVMRILHNEINPQETLEKVDLAVKNNNILFIDNCHSNIIDRIMTKLIKVEPKEKEKDKEKKSKEKMQFYLIANNNEQNISMNNYSYVFPINFSCTSELAKTLIKRSLITKYDYSLSVSLNKTRIEMQKGFIKELDNVKRMISSIEKYDYTANVEKLSSNEITMQNYERDVQECNSITKNINICKGRIYSINMELEIFESLSVQAAKLYKWIAKYFYIHNGYNFSFEVFTEKMKKFYEDYADMSKDNNGNPIAPENTQVKEEKENQDDEENEEQSDNSKEDDQHDEEQKDDEEDHQLPSIKMGKHIKPKKLYKNADLIKLIEFLIEELGDIFDDDVLTKNVVVFSLLFYSLKQSSILPNNYKSIIRTLSNITSITSNEEPPIPEISHRSWNILQMLCKDEGNYLGALLSNIKENKETWSSVLKDNNWLNHDLEISYLVSQFDKNKEKSKEILESLSPFDILIFYSVLAPKYSNIFMPILISQQLPSFDISKITKLDSIIQTSSPILLFDNDHIYEREITDIYLPKLKGANNDFKYKEIVLKGEIPLSELEVIISIAKVGGIVLVKNIHLANDSIGKLFGMIKELEDTVNESFKLIFLVEKNIINCQLQSILFKTCKIVNHNGASEEEFAFKTHFANVIKYLPKETVESILNRKNPNFNTYSRKILVTFIFLHILLKEIPRFRTDLYITPVNYIPSDLRNVVEFINNFLNTLTEDKEVHYSNIENELGIHYMNIISVAAENFYLGRLVYKEDVFRMSRFINRFFDEETFYNPKALLIYDGEVIAENSEENSKNEMTIDDLIDVLMSIHEDKLYEILSSVAGEEIANNIMISQCRKFYSTIATAVYGKEEKSSNSLINSVISLPSSSTLLKKTVDDLKMNLYDTIRYGEEYASPSLFKLNKQGDFSNPIDEVLLHELTLFNKKIELFNFHIKTLNSILIGQIPFSIHYMDIMRNLSQGFMPAELCDIINCDKPMKYDDWKVKMKEKYEYFSSWVEKGEVEVYNMNYLTNYEMFFSCARMYFCRREETISPDMIVMKLSFADEKTEDSDNKNKFLPISGIHILNASFDPSNHMISKKGKTIEELPKINVLYEIRQYKVEEDPSTTQNPDVIIEDSDEESKDEEEKEAPKRLQNGLLTDENKLHIPLYEFAVRSDDDRHPIAYINMNYDSNYTEDDYILSNIKLYIK